MPFGRQRQKDKGRSICREQRNLQIYYLQPGSYVFGPFDYLFVCQPDDRETIGPIFRKPGGRVWQGPRTHPLKQPQQQLQNHFDGSVSCNRVAGVSVSATLPHIARFMFSRDNFVCRNKFCL